MEEIRNTAEETALQEQAAPEPDKKSKKNRGRCILSFFAGILCADIFILAVFYAGLMGWVKIPVVYVLSNEQNGVESLVSKESTLKIMKMVNYIQNNYLFDIDDETMTDMICSGVMAGLDDPYSAYYDAETYEELQEDLEGNFCGIGVTVQKDADTGALKIVKVFSDAPAEEAGLQAGDLIVEADGVDLTAMELSEAVSHVKGEEGTTVELTVYREGEDQLLTITSERRQIEIDTVTWQMLDNHIGYIAIDQFDSVTADQFAEAKADLEAQGMEALIVDVRNNPGGLLQSVVTVLQGLLPEGKIVYCETNAGVTNTYYSDGENEFTLPMVVLANGNSASAAEIFTAALQDYGIATVVGTQTFGKGIVQVIYQFDDGSAIKMTTSRYYTPNGVCIHGEGIAPDVEVELDESVSTLSVIPLEQDNQLQKAIEVITEQMQ